LLSAASFDSSGSSPARASRRLSRPEPASRSGFSLAHDDRPFLSGHYEVTVPDLPLQRLAGPSSGRFGPRLLASAGLPRHWRSQRRLPVALVRVPRSRSRLGSRFPFGVSPSGSLRSPDLRPKSSPSQTARCPLLPAQSVRRRRIVAPNSLLLRRLAVPQTSWNRFNSLTRGSKSQ